MKSSIFSFIKLYFDRLANNNVIDMLRTLGYYTHFYQYAPPHCYTLLVRTWRLEFRYNYAIFEINCEFSSQFGI